MEWQLYSIPFPYDGSVNLIASDTQPGDFVSFARNNTMFFPSARDVGYFTVPDGVTANTVAIAAVTFGEDSEIRVVVERQAIFPTFRGATNAEPRQSYDRRWMTFTLTTPNSDNSLYALDLVNSDNPPIIVGAGARGDTVSALAFSPDSARVIYTAGSSDGGDNSIFALDLESGTSARIRRGNFGRWLFVAPDGVRAAADEWVSVQDGNQTRQYHALRVVDLNTNTETTLFEDTTSPANARQSAVPLAWRVSS
jgi:WD40 repeat protein